MPVKLPKYVLSHNREELAAPVVMQMVKPYMIGQVWRFKDPGKFAEFVAGYDGLGIATVTGYMIAVTFGGTVTEHRLQIYPGIEKDIKRTMEEMSEFYHKERIAANPKDYKRFLL